MNVLINKASCLSKHTVIPASGKSDSFLKSSWSTIYAFRKGLLINTVW